MLRRTYKLFLFAISILLLLIYVLSLITNTSSTSSHSDSVQLSNPLPAKTSENFAVRHGQDHANDMQEPPLPMQKQLPDTLFREDLKPKLAVQPKIGFLYKSEDNSQPQNDQEAVPSDSKQQYESGVRNSYGFLSSQPKLKIPYKLVHIDLKGAPPKISYLKYFLKTVKAAGGNGILLEYEDMFPFRGALNGTSHKFHYKDEDIREIIASAKENDLEIIPLIQTFGHLEFVLKLDKFSHLRELNEFPQEICPSNEIAWKMVKSIIDQVMDFHQPPRYSYLHIGCDEVYHIGECDRCKGKELKDLFINHVMRVADYVKKKYGVTSIIWDDMLRKFYAEELVKSGIGSAVEVMMWDYTDDVDRLLSPFLWPMYGQVFPNIWVASAYKGAFGETLYKVDIHRHAINHLSWLRVLQREQGRIKNFRGFAITGWSRYDHFAVLCELLPMAIPSMILALEILAHQDLEKASTELFKHLKCDGGSLSRLEECRWNGVELYNTIASLQFYEEQTSALLKTHRKDKGWLTPYSLHHNYSSPFRLVESIQSAQQYLMSIKVYEGNVQSVLRKYYEEHVVTEWIEQKIGSVIQDLESLVNDANSLSARKAWGPRPA